MKKDLVKKKKWEEKFCEWKKSKQSIRSWCIEQNISCSAFHYWKNIFSNKNKEYFLSKDSFTKIPLDNNTSSFYSSEIKVNYKGFFIYLSQDFNIKTFQKIIRSFAC